VGHRSERVRWGPRLVAIKPTKMGHPIVVAWSGLLSAINSATQCKVMLPPNATEWFIRTFGDTAHLLANPLICW
jgi:hypothetical protein